MSDAVEGNPGIATRPGAGTILLWTSWFGLCGGALELVAFLAKCLYFAPRNYNVSRQFPWMYPLAGLAIVAAPGLVLALGAALRPRRIAAAPVLFALAFPAYLGLLFRLPLLTAACLVLAGGLALRTALSLVTRVGKFDRVVRRSLPILIAAFVATLAACQIRDIRPISRAGSNDAEGRPNVLLIVLDTVRAESLSLYGYHRATTPNIERYASRGVRFDLAFSTAPWTAPSHAGMFTGRPPHELSIGWGRPLDRSSPTLAGYLGSRGYATAGFVANSTYCSYETGLDRGFAHYEDYDVNPWSVLLCSSVVQRSLTFIEKHPALFRGGRRATAGNRKDAGRINRDVLSWIADRPADRPFFAFLNYYDAHHPYFVPGDAPGPSFGRVPGSPRDYQLIRTWWGSDKSRLKPEEIELARDSYDRCIAYLDGQVGKLLDELDRRGILRGTLVVVTSDHGEHLGEQRLFGHGASLYRPEIQVPLVLLPPGGIPDGRTVPTPVSLSDLPATVVDLLQLADRSPFPGHPLGPIRPGDPEASRPRSGPVRSELAGPSEDDPNGGKSPACLGPMTSLIAEGHHYIRNGDGREELFDIAADPGEVRNLAATPELAATVARFREQSRR